MQISSLAGLLISGMLAAIVPLAMVWMSSDTNKYRKLVWLTAFLTFDLIVFGAFTRLTDSGLGCPDWPGCYGAANPFIAHAEIAAAEAAMPTGPVTVAKAWIEMIHRYLAMGVGFLIIALLITATVQWRRTKDTQYHPGLPAVLLVAVLIQGAFGAWTVTLKLQPVIVTIHLILGMTLFALLCWVGARQDRMMKPAAAFTVTRALRLLALASALVLAVQIALGGWVSTNYATLACLEFPTCNGKLVPEMDFEHGFTLWRDLGMTAAGNYIPFSALIAIHWVHRNFYFVVLAVLGLTAWLAMPHPALRKYARGIAALLIAQAATGLATIYFEFPLAIAVLHNAGAALLVLMVTMLNYQIRHRNGAQATHK